MFVHALLDIEFRPAGIVFVHDCRYHLPLRLRNGDEGGSPKAGLFRHLSQRKALVWLLFAARILLKPIALEQLAVVSSTALEGLSMSLPTGLDNCSEAEIAANVSCT